MTPAIPRTALLVVDVQRDFCHPEGVCGVAGYPVADAVAAVTQVGRLLAAARVADVEVVHIRLEVDWDSEDQLWLDQLLRLGQPGLCSPGSVGAAAYSGAEELPGELVVAKRRYSGFWRTDLTELLRGRDVGRVVVCGVATNICVQATACDAFMEGFAVELAADASGAFLPAAHDAAVALIDLAYGTVATTDELVARWAGRPVDAAGALAS